MKVLISSAKAEWLFAYRSRFSAAQARRALERAVAHCAEELAVRPA